MILSGRLHGSASNKANLRWSWRYKVTKSSGGKKQSRVRLEEEPSGRLDFVGSRRSEGEVNGGGIVEEEVWSGE